MDDRAALNKTIHIISDLIVGPVKIQQHYAGEPKTICDDTPKENGMCVKEVPITDTITETPEETIIFKNFNFEFPSQKRKNNFDEEQNEKRMKIEDDNDLKAFNYMTGTYETVEATTTEFLEDFGEFNEELTSPEENALALEASAWVEEEQIEKPSLAQLKDHNSIGVNRVNDLTTQNINFNNAIVKNDSLENSASFTHLTVLPKASVKEHSSISLLECLIKENSPIKNKLKESIEYCNRRSLFGNVSIKQRNKSSCNTDFIISSIIPPELGKQSLLLNYLTSKPVNPQTPITSNCSTITVSKAIVKTMRNSEKTYNEEILKVTKPEILKGRLCRRCGYYTKKPSNYKRHKNGVNSCQLYLKKNGKLLGLRKKTLVVVLCKKDFCVCQNTGESQPS